MVLGSSPGLTCAYPSPVTVSVSVWIHAQAAGSKCADALVPSRFGDESI